MAERVIMLAGRCGKHYREDCTSCQSALDCTNHEIRALHTQIEALAGALETLRDYVADTADGALMYRDGRYKALAEGVKVMAKDDLARIDAALTKLKEPNNADA